MLFLPLLVPLALLIQAQPANDTSSEIPLDIIRVTSDISFGNSSIAAPFSEPTFLSLLEKIGNSLFAAAQTTSDPKPAASSTPAGIIKTDTGYSFTYDVPTTFTDEEPLEGPFIHGKAESPPTGYIVSMLKALVNLIHYSVGSFFHKIFWYTTSLLDMISNVDLLGKISLPLWYDHAENIVASWYAEKLSTLGQHSLSLIYVRACSSSSTTQWLRDTTTTSGLWLAESTTALKVAFGHGIDNFYQWIVKTGHSLIHQAVETLEILALSLEQASWYQNIEELEYLLARETLHLARAAKQGGQVFSKVLVQKSRSIRHVFLEGNVTVTEKIKNVGSLIKAQYIRFEQAELRAWAKVLDIVGRILELFNHAVSYLVSGITVLYQHVCNLLSLIAHAPGWVFQKVAGTVSCVTSPIIQTYHHYLSQAQTLYRIHIIGHVIAMHILIYKGITISLVFRAIFVNTLLWWENPRVDRIQALLNMSSRSRLNTSNFYYMDYLKHVLNDLPLVQIAGEAAAIAAAVVFIYVTIWLLHPVVPFFFKIVVAVVRRRVVNIPFLVRAGCNIKAIYDTLVLNARGLKVCSIFIIDPKSVKKTWCRGGLSDPIHETLEPYFKSEWVDKLSWFILHLWNCRFINVLAVVTLGINLLWFTVGRTVNAVYTRFLLVLEEEAEPWFTPEEEAIVAHLRSFVPKPKQAASQAAVPVPIPQAPQAPLTILQMETQIRLWEDRIHSHRVFITYRRRRWFMLAFQYRIWDKLSEDWRSKYDNDKADKLINKVRFAAQGRLTFLEWPKQPTVINYSLETREQWEERYKEVESCFLEYQKLHDDLLTCVEVLEAKAMAEKHPRYGPSLEELYTCLRPQPSPPQFRPVGCKYNPYTGNIDWSPFREVIPAEEIEAKEERKAASAAWYSKPW